MESDLEIPLPAITSHGMEAIYLSEAFVVVQLQPDLQPLTAVAPSDTAAVSAGMADATPDKAERAVPTTGAAPLQDHPVLIRRGFEIVDRRSNREVYLDGAWAEIFARQIDDWRERAAPREEVEATLEGYTQLAQAKLALH